MKRFLAVITLVSLLTGCTYHAEFVRLPESPLYNQAVMFENIRYIPLLRFCDYYDLDYNWESLAWVRMPRRPSPGKDIVLIRFDVAEPVLHLLNTEGRPANECLVGYILVEHKIAYVALVDLVGIPTRELDALSKKPD